jgi:hypothetical protein
LGQTVLAGDGIPVAAVGGHSRIVRKSGQAGRPDGSCFNSVTAFHRAETTKRCSLSEIDEVRLLERTISSRLERQYFCLVPEYELLRVWPAEEDRLRKVEQFATERHWRLFSYIKGRGAIFIRKGAMPSFN